MYVCICAAVTDQEIRAAAATGISGFEELQDKFGVATQCGQCADCARRILRDACIEQAREVTQTA